MNAKNLILKVVLAVSPILVSFNAHAEYEPPRGPDVDSVASNCGIGPFPQVGKAGPYNNLCAAMTDAEKCLALVKGQMTSDGSLYSANYDSERIEYCLETFRVGLFGLKDSQ